MSQLVSSLLKLCNQRRMCVYCARTSCTFFERQLSSSFPGTEHSSGEKNKRHGNVSTETEASRHIRVLGFSNSRIKKYWRTKPRNLQEEVTHVGDPGKNISDDLPVFLKLKRNSGPQEGHTSISHETFSLGHESDTSLPASLESVVNFPYEAKTDIRSSESSGLLKEETPTNDLAIKETNLMRQKINDTVLGWIKYLEDNNVENLKDSVGSQPELHELQEEVWRLQYGSPDPSQRASKSTCRGCGAVIHCQDTTIPGYIPSERFKTLTVQELKRTLCQRCLFLEEHNVALSVNVAKDYYAKILSKIRHKTALVLLLVDLTDFPCSIWPGIVDIIGKKNPIIVVGNKVDLLPQDEDEYLSRVRKALVQNLQDMGIHRGGNLLDVHLISAKTYFGVEPLITKIFQHWSYKGDIFVVGCTNVGKSTLFNAFLQSDLCDIRAVDLIHRATTSVWPGTTLNLLKFPIRKMSGLRIAHRNQRLAETNKVLKQERLLRQSRYRVTRNPQYATLLGKLEVTTGGCDRIAEGLSVPTFCSPDDRRFANSHFCYDTPGAIYTDQILDLLTVEELVKTLPKEIIVPRTFTMTAEQTLFLAGLARIDILHVQNLFNVYVTVFSSPHLPVHIVATEDANQFYSQNLGSVLEVPSGGPERLSRFPQLKPFKFQCTGTRFDESCVDVVLSSAGWASLTVRRDEVCEFLAYTPEGRGCYLRQPSLLPLAVRLRGKRIHGSPVFENKKCSVVVSE